MRTLAARLFATSVAALALAACGDETTASTTQTVPRTRAVDAPSTTGVPATTVAATIAAADDDNAMHDVIEDHPLLFQTGGYVRIMPSDGTGDRVVAEGAPAGQEQPDWSPDGQEVLFQTNSARLWTAAIDGTAATARFECQAPCHAIQDGAWSPDGTEIAFMMAETNDGTTTSRSAIVALDLTTGNVRTVYEDTSGIVWLFSPRWSPDGRSLVFEEDTFASNLLSESRTTSIKLATVADDGSSSPEYITTGGAPDWSPQGDLIVFGRDDNLFLVGTDGTGEQQLTNFDGVEKRAIQPTFTPDGTGVVFTYVVGDAPTAAIIGIGGDGFSTVAHGQITHPRFGP